MAKTSTERSRLFLERKRAEQKLTEEKPVRQPKSGAQRAREYRARRKALKLAAATGAPLPVGTESTALDKAGKGGTLADSSQTILSVTQNLTSLPQVSSVPKAITVPENIAFACKNVYPSDSVGLLLAKNQIESKEDNVIDDNPELIIPDHARKKLSSNELIIDPKQAVLNATTIKQEINSDTENEKLATHERETLNGKSPNDAVDNDILLGASKVGKSKQYSSTDSKIINLIKMINPINGRRIVDVEHFFNTMQRINKHSKFGCDLNDIVITNEYKKGIQTSYQLKCKVCSFQEVMACENIFNRDLNIDFIEGMLSLNCNFDDINTLLAKLLLPSLSADFFVKQLDKISLDQMMEVSKESIDQSVDSSIACSKKRKFDQSAQVVLENVSSSSCKGKKIHQSDSAGLPLADNQFEINEENAIKDKSEFMISDQTIKKPCSSELIVDKEQATLNLVTIKQEIDSDLDGENCSGFETCERGILNRNSPNERIDLSKAAASQQKDVRTCENIMVFNEIKLQEDARNNKLIIPDFNSVTMKDEDNVTVIHIPPKVELPLKTGDKERTMNKKEIVSSYEAQSKRKMDDQQILFSIHENNGNSSYGDELHNSADAVEISIAAASKDNILKSRSESNRLENKTSKSSSIALDGENVYILPLQLMPESDANGTVFHPHMPPNLANETYHDAVQWSTNSSTNGQLSPANISRFTDSGNMSSDSPYTLPGEVMEKRKKATDEWKRKRELANARMRKYRERKQKAKQLDSKAQNDEIKEIIKKQIEELKAERRKECARERSRRYREKKRIDALKAVDHLIHDSPLPDDPPFETRNRSTTSHDSQNDEPVTDEIKEIIKKQISELKAEQQKECARERSRRYRERKRINALKAVDYLIHDSQIPWA